MQQGAHGTQRFCIKQLLKPIDNVSHQAFRQQPCLMRFPLNYAHAYITEHT